MKEVKRNDKGEQVDTLDQGLINGEKKLKDIKHELFWVLGLKVVYVYRTHDATICIWISLT
jgi:hypothetical protein